MITKSPRISKRTPAFIKSLTFNFPVLKARAFGGVETGNIKPKLAPNVAQRVKKITLFENSALVFKLAISGRISAAEAVFEPSSERMTPKRVTMIPRMTILL